MHSGQEQSQAWSHFANFFPSRDEQARSPTRSIAINRSHDGIPIHSRLDDEDLLGDSDLDEEQRISSALIEAEKASHSSTPHTPIPVAVLQASNVASSPAAMFLSAFSSPKLEPQPLPDDEDQKVAGYTLGKIVGFGAFSTIRKAYSESGGVVAVKIIRRGDLVQTGHAPEERKKLQHEAQVWSSLSHEHVLPLFSVVHTSYADYFITLYCPAGSLYDILKRDGRPALPQDDAGMMFRQVVRGLRYLHEAALLVHRDMKLENVLVDETGVCRIGDFGLSVKIGDAEDEEVVTLDQHEPYDAGYGHVHRAASMSVPSSKRHGKVSGLAGAISRHNSTRNRHSANSQTAHIYQPGSLPYAAPELLLPHTFELNPTHPSQDIWALGVMLYALLAGRLPFQDSFEPRLQMKILNGEFEIPADIGRGAERILKGCMERNVPKRWTIAMVDEVAWGVGWGSEGDSATPEESREDLLDFQPPPYSAPARIEVEVGDSDADDWQNAETFPRSAIEAGSRRSTSRAQRSLSRAPMLTRTPSSCSASRRSRPSSPHRNARSTSRFAALRSGSASRNHSPPPSPYYETGPGSRSRSRSRHRGRKPTKACYFTSRSPSPSVVPSTPSDINVQLLSKLNLREISQDMHLDSPPRGRTRFCLDHETFDEGDEIEADEKAHTSRIGSDAGDFAEHASDWTPPSASDESVSGCSDAPFTKSRANHVNPVRKTRPGSTPPASSKAWELYRSTKVPNQPRPSRHGSQDMFLTGFSPSPNPQSVISRSRSADCPIDSSRPVNKAKAVLS